jgi:hypothetical protein
MHLVFAVLALLVIAHQTSSVGQWLAASAFALVAGLCTVVALWTRRVWLDTLAAIVLVAMAPVFLWLNLEGLAG